MGIYLTKSMLYDEVQKIRLYLDISEDTYGTSLDELCKKRGILIDSVPFKTKGLRGMAIADNEHYRDDTILLNNKRNEYEKNFDCGHELVHLRIHRYEQQNFSCHIEHKQNCFLEWQANEGSAELLVPYKQLLRKISSMSYLLESSFGIAELKYLLSYEFFTTKQVIENRLESLKYEIYQYLSGIDISNILLLSNTQLEKDNIKIRSINDLEIDMMASEMLRIY